MVRCANGAYYTGSTNNLEKRIALHNAGRGAKYLRGKLPVTLVYAREYRYYKTAWNAEMKIKTLSRKEKEELIREYAHVANLGRVERIPRSKRLKLHP